MGIRSIPLYWISKLLLYTLNRGQRSFCNRNRNRFLTCARGGRALCGYPVVNKLGMLVQTSEMQNSLRFSASAAKHQRS